MSEEQFDEGEDYLTEDTVDRLIDNQQQSSNAIVNIIANLLNEQIENKGLKHKFHVVGEDLLSALTKDDMYDKQTRKEIVSDKGYKDDKKRINGKKEYYIFVFDSDYKTAHTTLWVINNTTASIDHFDTQNYLKEGKIKGYETISAGRKDREKEICRELRTYFGINNYSFNNYSDHILKQKQKDTFNCAYYCSLIIDNFITKGTYDINDSAIRGFNQGDVNSFKSDLLNKLMKRTKALF